MLGELFNRRRRFIRGTLTPLKGPPREQRFVIERYGLDVFAVYAVEVPPGVPAYRGRINVEKALSSSGDEYLFKGLKSYKHIAFDLKELQGHLREMWPSSVEQRSLGNIDEKLAERYADELRETKRALRRKRTALGERVAWVPLDDLADLKPKPFDPARTAEIVRGFKEGRLLPPIVVGIDERGRYLIEGNHRLAAARALGLKKVLVAFKPGAES